MQDRDASLLGQLAEAVFPAPIRQDTNRSALEQFYESLPIRLPLVYEKFIVSYRWVAEAHFGPFQLLANPVGDPSLAGLLGSVRYDSHLADALLPAAFFPFARPADGSWDPICFNGSIRAGKHDQQVVRIDHEGILCNNRITIRKVLAPSFRVLVENVLAAR